MTAYAKKVSTILSPELRRLFSTLHSPQKIQDYLDTLKTNFELTGDTMLSPALVAHKKTAHCFEGAVFAAAVFAYHGERPLLMDFETLPSDEDHTITLFTQKNHWGSISKTNHVVLKYRDPVYASPRELALSFFNEYYLWDGTKSMLSYSKPFDLSRYAPEKWITTKEPLDWLMTKITHSGYYEVVPPDVKLRKAVPIELKALKLIEWNKRGERLI